MSAKQTVNVNGIEVHVSTEKQPLPKLLPGVYMENPISPPRFCAVLQK